MTLNDLTLEGRTAVVCGSTQGIGLAAAQDLARLGAKVVCIARDEERLREAVSTLTGSGHGYLVADFAHPDQLAAVLSRFIAEGGEAHILVNNTGGPPAGTAIDADIDAFRIAFNQHLICNHTLVQHLVPGMKRAGYGRIINVISTSVKQPLPNLGVSNTVRGAVANWSKTLARELGPFGITVNNVLPGATDTARLNAIIQRKSGQSGAAPDAVRSEMAAEVPLGRIGKPEEIAHAIAFLASPAAAYISGINLPVDGGRTACL